MRLLQNSFFARCRGGLMPDCDREAENARVCVAVISGVRGVHGEVRIRAYTEDANDLTAYGPLTFEDGAPVGLKKRGMAKGEVIARLDGVESREQAERMKGTKLYALRSNFPAPDEDEFYYDQLVGLQVRTLEGETIGEVIAVQEFGAGDLIDVKLAGQKRSVFIPFTREIVPTIDVAQGYLVVAPPVGLLDEAEPEP